MELFINGYNLQLPDQFEQVQVSAIQNFSFYTGTLTLPIDSDHLPARSDAKIMRDDVIASVVIVSEMLASLNGTQTKDEISLIVANGAFVDYGGKLKNFVNKVYQSLDPEMLSKNQLVNNIYRFSPPLIILETLTNSTMSFIAQYTGLKSHNTTLGNTSIASFYALQEAEHNSAKKSSMILVSSNCGGVYSFLTNSAILGFKEEWRESSASACLLLSGENEGAFAKITQLVADNTIPDLYKNEIVRNWKQLLPDSKADAIIFSGAFDLQSYQEDLDYCQRLNMKVDSLFNHFGNMGPSNLYAGIIHAIKLFSDQYQVFDIVDRDVYGRESLVRVERC
jgi:hypothetical protein